MSTTDHDIEQAKVVLQINELAKAAGLPTYTELETTLTELAMYVKRGVSSDAMQASAQRAIELLAPDVLDMKAELAKSAEGLDLSIAHDRSIFRSRVAQQLKGCSVTLMRSWISNPPLDRASLVRAIADDFIGG